MSEKIDLLPCPFCGNDAEIRPYRTHGCQVQCKDCGAAISGKVLRFTIDWLKGKLIDAWNKRASPSPAAPQISIGCPELTSPHEILRVSSDEQTITYKGVEYFRTAAIQPAASELPEMDGPDDPWRGFRDDYGKFSIEKFISTLAWSDQTTEHEKTLIAGNLRNLYAVLEPHRDSADELAKSTKRLLLIIQQSKPAASTLPLTPEQIAKVNAATIGIGPLCLQALAALDWRDKCAEKDAEIAELKRTDDVTMTAFGQLEEKFRSQVDRAEQAEAEIERLIAELEGAHRRGWDLALIQANRIVSKLNHPKAIEQICSIDYAETITRVAAAIEQARK